MPIKIDKLFGRKKSVPIPVPVASNTRTTVLGDGIDLQGLFIIGAARSGTTILQNALNDASDIFLFGEPRFHHEPGTDDFAGRYNDMHRAWKNQETKSSYCPRLFTEDARWNDYLVRLCEIYRLVGSKIVVNPWHASEEVRTIFDFHCRHFYRSRYLFTFRNPLDVLMSTQGLAKFNGGNVASGKEVIRGYFNVVQLFLQMLRNLPHVQALFHEAIDAARFRDLESFLGLPLSGAAAYYDQRKVRHYGLGDVVSADQSLAGEALAIYEDFKQEALAGFDLLQIEQNDDHLSPVHFTRLGRLSWRIKRFVATLED